MPRDGSVQRPAGSRAGHVEDAELFGDCERLQAGCEPTHVELFRRRVVDLLSFAKGQDIIYVGGGNTANMLAVWRLQGFDRALREALTTGTILAGVSAGSACWFECAVTDSFGPELAQLNDGLGFLTGSNCPH